VTIRDDLREGRIFNRRILQGLGMGAFAYLLLASAELMRLDPVLCSGPLPEGSWHWSLVVLLDLGLGLLVGVLLWMLGIWAAGDAKLFALYAFLVPPACTTRSFLPSFPALPVLVNVFAFVFMFLVVDMVRTSLPAVLRVARDPELRAAALRRAPGKLVRFLPLLLVFVAMFAGIRSLREVSREGLSPILQVSDFTMFMVLFIVFRPLMRLVTNKWGAIVFTTVSVVALGYLVWRHGPGHVPELVTPSVMAVVLLVFARAYPAIGQTSLEMSVKDLRPGMMLGRQSLRVLGLREKREVREAAERSEHLPRAHEEEPGTTARPSRFGQMTAEGLTDEQIRYVRTRWNDDEPIAVARTIPFSPFLAAGAFVTVVVGGPLTMFVAIS
jgi:prepilin signal peptidase PulO-like enzyme (type II secretory pathway)